MNPRCLLAVLCLSFLLTETGAVIGMGVPLHCHCINYERRMVPLKMITKIDLIPRGSHCSIVQVIAKLKSGDQICLNLRAPWVKKFIKKRSKNLQ
ncbi:interleukin-8-like [Acipenser oxyrinchus oxyrinchus]|uniref:C-X-C motif chemokine n=1 Tax=Acipenser oxyrinchus oxyrinchus TaxID=40147 RepID=A0AAD8LUR1_ACIOX|nr:interleukin-8-like [Acipenser oxyrinchus oxyrinchus]